MCRQCCDDADPATGDHPGSPDKDESVGQEAVFVMACPALKTEHTVRKSERVGEHHCDREKHV